MNKLMLNYIHRCYVRGAIIAQSEVAKAIKRGDLRSPKTCVCADCGVPARDYDHRDYNKPLNVVAVCRRCNIKRGAAIPRKWNGVEELYAYLTKCKSIRRYERYHGFDMRAHTNPVLRKQPRKPKAVTAI